MRIVSVEQVSHRYRTGLWGQRSPQFALRSIDVHICAGENVGLIGESGSGKTTLAKCIAGLIQPEAGTVHVETQTSTLSAPPLPRPIAPIRCLFQSAHAHLNPALSVHGHLHESAKIHRRGESDTALVNEALKRFGLKDRANALPHQLSGGEQRRVNLAGCFSPIRHFSSQTSPPLGWMQHSKQIWWTYYSSKDTGLVAPY